MNLYPYYKQVALDTGSADHVDVNSDTLKVVLLQGGVFDSADKYLSDLLADAGVTEVARSGALTAPTVANGTFDAADITVAAVATGHTVDSIAVFKDTGVATTSTLVCFIDKATDGTTALSLPTNGSDITVAFHASGIYDL